MTTPTASTFHLRVLAWSSAALSGIMLGMSFPTAGYTILAWVALVPLSHALVFPGATPFVRFALGWVAGITFTGLVLLRTEAFAETFRELLSQDITQALLLWLWSGLTCVLAALPLAFFSLVSGVFLRLPCLLTSVLLTTCLWTGVEYLTAWIAPSTSWVVLAHSVAPSNPLAQNVDLLGVYGLGFLIALNNSAVHACLAHSRSRVRWIPLVIVLTVTGILFQRGDAILHEDPGELASDFESDAALRVTLLRFDPARADEGIQLTIASLKGSAGDPRPRLVVWPAPTRNNAPGFGEMLGRDSEIATVAFSRPLYWVYWERSRLPELGFNVVTFPTGGSPVDGERVFTPRVITLAGGLVPFEVGALGDGDLRTPRAARRLAAAGATLFVASINEKGGQDEYRYALSTIASAYRAIENRKWVVRCSAGGVSACIDPRGRIEGVLLPGVYGDLKQAVQAYEGKTPYALAGWLLAPICLLISIVGCVMCLRKSRRSRGKGISG